MREPRNTYCVRCGAWVPVAKEISDGHYLHRLLECGHDDRIEIPDLSEVIDEAVKPW